MATFTVDPATLRELSCTLSGIHSEMNAMHGVATGFEGLLGGGGLDGEVEGFCSHWGYGLGQMSDQSWAGGGQTRRGRPGLQQLRSTDRKCLHTGALIRRWATR